VPTASAAEGDRPRLGASLARRAQRRPEAGASIAGCALAAFHEVFYAFKLTPSGPPGFTDVDVQIHSPIGRIMGVEGALPNELVPGARP
jgi:hypothetical protein